MSEKKKIKRALVLSGGGGRGAYQIGAWEAFREQGIEFDLVCGTSVGALNGAMVAQGDLDIAHRAWEELILSDIVDLDMPGLDLHRRTDMLRLAAVMAKLAVKEGGASVDPLRHVLEKYVSEERVRTSELEFALVTVKYPSMQPCVLHKNEIPEGKLIDFMMASAACYPAFKAYEIDGETYIDGGYYDNLPINIAIEWGADEIYTVDLRAMLGLRARPHYTRAKIISVMPFHKLGSLVSFDREFSERNIRWGYLDALKSLGCYEGGAYAFFPGESAPAVRRRTPAFARIMPLLTEGSSLSLAKAIRLRLRGLKKYRPDYGGEFGCLIPLCAEMAGEIFELPDREPLRFAEFDRELLLRFDEWRDRWNQLMPSQHFGLGTLAELRHGLSMIDRKALTAYLVWAIGEAGECRLSAADLQTRAVAFPREVAAALYIRALEE